MHVLAPPDDTCPVCGSAMEWCVGGMRCTREHDEKHEGRCLTSGDWDHCGPCEDA
jgi:hypothetical protein